jgi:hypothetical protein
LKTFASPKFSFLLAGNHIWHVRNKVSAHLDIIGRLLIRVVIISLLQHDPTLRPTAVELSQSPLLPQRLEDEYFKGALKMMSMFFG